MTGKITGALREQSDWEQQDENRLGFIKNKPFYDTRKAEPLTIAIPQTEYLETGVLLGESVVKVSNASPTYEELKAGYMDKEGTYPLNGDDSVLDDVSSEVGFPFYMVSDYFIIITDNNTDGLSAGIWCLESVLGNMKAKGDIVTLHVPSVTTGELKTLDPKFLPSGFATVTLTTVIPMSESLSGAFSEEESVNLTTVYESGNPVLITAPTEAGFSMQALAYRVLEAKGFILTLPLGEVLLCVGLVDAENTGTWTYRVSGTPMT